jgi:hypothetical protein
LSKGEESIDRLYEGPRVVVWQIVFRQKVLKKASVYVTPGVCPHSFVKAVYLFLNYYHILYWMCKESNVTIYKLAIRS